MGEVNTEPALPQKEKMPQCWNKLSFPVTWVYRSSFLTTHPHTQGTGCSRWESHHSANQECYDFWFKAKAFNNIKKLSKYKALKILKKKNPIKNIKKGSSVQVLNQWSNVNVKQHNQSLNRAIKKLCMLTLTWPETSARSILWSCYCWLPLTPTLQSPLRKYLQADE